MRHFRAFATIAFVFLLACSPKPASTFKDPEIAYLRGLFRPYGQPGWPTMGKTERETEALASFRTHPAEALPILMKGWEEGWQGYPWPEKTPPRMSVPPLNDDLLSLIICLDPAGAETMLVGKFKDVKGHPAADLSRDIILSNLYWRLHSKQTMPLFKELLAEDPDRWRFLFVTYLAQENDPSGLAEAKLLLGANGEKCGPSETAMCEATICQFDGDAKALQEMCVRYKGSKEALYPLWALVFMGRRDLVEQLAGPPERIDAALRVMRAAELWEKERNSPPCETREVKSLFEMTVLNQYTPPGPAR